jgi:hypothetical protein
MPVFHKFTEDRPGRVRCVLTRIWLRLRQEDVHEATVDLSQEGARFDLAKSLAPKVSGFEVADLELALMGVQHYLTNKAEWPDDSAAADCFWRFVPGSPPETISNFVVRGNRRSTRRYEGVLDRDDLEASLALLPCSYRSEWSFRDFLGEVIPSKILRLLRGLARRPRIDERPSRPLRSASSGPRILARPCLGPQAYGARYRLHTRPEYPTRQREPVHQLFV